MGLRGPAAAKQAPTRSNLQVNKKPGMSTTKSSLIKPTSTPTRDITPGRGVPKKRDTTPVRGVVPKKRDATPVKGIT